MANFKMVSWNLLYCEDSMYRFGTTTSKWRFLSLFSQTNVL